MKIKKHLGQKSNNYFAKIYYFKWLYFNFKKKWKNINILIEFD